MVNTIYLFSFVETPRKFIIAELSIRKLGFSSVLIILVIIIVIVLLALIMVLLLLVIVLLVIILIVLLALMKIRAYGSKALQ